VLCQALSRGTELEFTYSVKWEATPIKFGKRFERYLDYNFFEHQIHWQGGSSEPPLERRRISSTCSAGGH